MMDKIVRGYSLFLFSIIMTIPLYSQTLSSPEFVISLSHSVFEVVVPRLEEKDNFSYAEPLPWDLVPFAQRTDPYNSIGTAFCIGENRFLSAAHVFALEQESFQEDFFLRDSNGRLYPVNTVLGYSNRHDFILFSVDDASLDGTGRPHPMDGAELPQLNTKVYSVGNAYGEGIILRDGLLTSLTPESRNGEWHMLRFSAAASPGNSGGPLLDQWGKVLGIVTARSENENYNLALPLKVVEEVPEYEALLNNRFSYGLPIFSYEELGVENYRIPLPLPLKELKHSLVSYKEYFLRDLLSSLCDKNSSKLFPISEGSEYLLRTPFSSYMPGFAVEQSDYVWKMEYPSDKSRVYLKDSGSFEWGSWRGYDIQRYVRPENRSIQDLAMKTTDTMDHVLSGFPLTRSLAGKKIRITSLGKTASSESFTDKRGRPWFISCWDIPFANQVILWFRHLTPDGFVGLMRITEKKNRLPILEDVKFIIDFMDIDYSGTLAQWKEYLSDSHVSPQVLRKMTLSPFGSGRRFNNGRFSLRIDTSDFPLSDDTVFSCCLSLLKDSKEGVVWDMDGLFLKSPNPDGALLSLNRIMNPGKNLDSDRQRQWAMIQNETVPYDRNVYTDAGKPFINGVYKFTPYAPQGHEHLENAFTYLLTLSYESALPTETIQQRFSSFSSEFQVSEEEAEAALGLPKSAFVGRGYTFIQGKNIFDALRTGDMEILGKFIDAKVDLNTRDGNGRTPLLAALQGGSEKAFHALLNCNIDLDVQDHGAWNILMEALRYDKPELARILLERGAEVDVADSDGRTPLMLAIRYGQLENAGRILDRNPDVKARKIDDWDALMFALRYDAPEIAKRLIMAGADIHKVSVQQQTPLYLALQHGQEANARLLLEKGVEVNVVNDIGWTPLMIAIRYGQLENAGIILDRKADIQARTKYGWSALMFALRYEAPEIATRLIEAGADVSLANDEKVTPFMYALCYGQKENARRILDRKPDIHHRDKLGLNALMYALRYDTPDLARKLIEAGADMLTPNNAGWTPLMYALRYNHKENANMILEHVIDVNQVNDDGGTALIYALDYGAPDIAAELIKSGADIDFADQRGLTPLMQALQYGQPSNARLLLDMGAEVNVANDAGWTPLMHAIRYGQLENAERIMNKGADIHVSTKDGWSALMFALRHEAPEIATRLIEAGAEVSHANSERVTPLMYALCYGQKENARRILDRKPYIHYRDKNGWSALMYALRYDTPEVAKLLLEEHADIGLADDEGWTPLMLAIRYGQLENAQIILDLGADIHARKNNGWTVLMMALAYGSTDLGSQLILAGSDLHVSNEKGRTPLMLALMNKKPDNARLILDNKGSISGTDYEGWTPLMMAIYYEYEDIALRLLDLGADIKGSNNNGRTTLMYALQYMSSIADRLIQMGADVNGSLENGRTPVTLALRYGTNSQVRLLLERGAKVDAVTDNGWTTLMYAAVYQKESVPLLLPIVENLDAVNVDGRTALHLAVRNADTETVRLILERGAKVDTMDTKGQSPLTYARSKDKKDVIAFLEKYTGKP